MIDKEYIKKLTASLCFELSDNQTNQIINEIELLDKQLQQAEISLKNLKAQPTNYSRAVNCSTFRKDVVSFKQDKEYLSNAKVINNYVVGK